jgi:2-polyprenyl-3-methyl-5-hydroxy-6-metoxy-1,4-benzoquinol methylase
MTGAPGRFDADSVRESWDRVAATFDRAQASGLDYYRCEFFGPAQVEMCGDVRGMSLIDVGCGSGYFAREMARRGARVRGSDGCAWIATSSVGPSSARGSDSARR